MEKSTGEKSIPEAHTAHNIHLWEKRAAQSQVIRTSGSWEGPSPWPRFRHYSPQTVTLGAEECELKAMTILLKNHSFICLFTLSIFFEHLLCARHCHRGWVYSGGSTPSTLQGLPSRQGDIHQADIQPTLDAGGDEPRGGKRAGQRVTGAWWGAGGWDGSRWLRRDAEMASDTRRQDEQKGKDRHKGPGHEGRKWTRGQSSLRALGPSGSSGFIYYPIFYTISARSSRSTSQVTNPADSRTLDTPEDDMSPLRSSPQNQNCSVAQKKKKEKKSDKPKLRDSLRTTWPVLLKAVKFITDTSKSGKLSQPQRI